MIEFTDQRGNPVYVNPRHVKVLTDNGSGGTQVWLEYDTPHYPGSRSSVLNVLESPREVARAITMTLNLRPYSVLRPKKPRSREQGSLGMDEPE